MAVHGPDLVGRRFSSQHTRLVTAEAISTFASAIGADPRFTPPTFLISFSVAAAEEFLPTIGFDWARVVHGDQRFVINRPIVAGDSFKCSSTIENYKVAAGNEIVTVRSDLHSGNQLVVSTWSTLVVRA